MTPKEPKVSLDYSVAQLPRRLNHVLDPKSKSKSALLTSYLYTCYHNPVDQMVSRKGKMVKCQFFRCVEACDCKFGGVRRYYDTEDRNSTGGLARHLRAKHKALLQRVINGEAPPNEDVLKRNPTIEAMFRKRGARETYSLTPYDQIASRLVVNLFHIRLYTYGTQSRARFMGVRECSPILYSSRPTL